MVRLNCEAVVALSGAYVPELVERDGGGAILIVASRPAMQPIPGQATYGASKAFALSFAEALHTELSHLGVAVTALCPGPVDTEFAAHAGLEEAFDDGPGVRARVERGLRAGRHRGPGQEQARGRPGPGDPARSLAGRHTPRAVLLPLMKRFYPV